MKLVIRTLLALALVIPFLSKSASAFSVSALTYSSRALQLIVSEDAILNQIPPNESITSIEELSRTPYQFEVKAGPCTLTVELSTKTPTGFIGTGLPHDPTVVNATGCHQ